MTHKEPDPIIIGLAIGLAFCMAIMLAIRFL